MLFDTHMHVNHSKFDEDREEVLKRAQKQGVSMMVNVGFNRETIPETLELAEKYDFVYAAIGFVQIWTPSQSMKRTMLNTPVRTMELCTPVGMMVTRRS